VTHISRREKKGGATMLGSHLGAGKKKEGRLRLGSDKFKWEEQQR